MRTNQQLVTRGETIAPAERETPSAKTLRRARTVVEPALRSVTQQFCPTMKSVVGYHQGWLTADGEPATASAGKGIRQALALLASRAAGDETAGIPAAVAVELVHSFSLLHDDVMDGDRTRRNRPTAWTVFGASEAILAGDALLVTAFQTLLTCGHPAAPEAARVLAATLQSLVRGQSADLEFERRHNITVDQCTAMIEDKTASLLAAACTIGALLGGAPDDLVDGLTGFGRQLGIAFQSTDDLLGIWGDPALTGKPTGTDLLRRKKSVPVVAALQSGSPHAAALADHYRRTHRPDTDELIHLARLIEDCGGREFTEHHAAEAVRRAEQHLDVLDLSHDVRTGLLELLHLTAHRDL
ncbi:polyprenyl synthetase family protein [Kitasatospora sp. NE20-6]|uniref:polyprenyl synthetase family protein n=1 Tax=Kitasatospora sp. NE20-6 TaxID=2859066 RepID=UPI0038B3CCA6